MSSYFGYTNTRDLQFVFQEWLSMGEVYDLPPFADMVGDEDVPELLESMRAYAKGALEDVDAAGESFGVRFEDGAVTCCEEYGSAFQQLQEDGWGTSNLDDDPEAYRLPRSLLMGVHEVASAACLPVVGLMVLTTCVTDLVKRYGNEEVREQYLPHLIAGDWTGALCLTETTCGSDVGALQTRATATDDPRIFTLRGNKQFISYGDHNLGDNIVYAVLARVRGAVPGAHGLSLFIVPKYWEEEDGTLTLNGVSPVGIETKMGLHGMPTVRMAFGQTGECRGWLLGANPADNDGKGQGMAQIFTIINMARMNVSMYATAMAANAVCCAREYAKGRIQGAPTTDPHGQSVPIIEHEDVRLTLLDAKSHVEAMRALVYRTMRFMDLQNFSDDEEVRREAADWVEFGVPICKAYCAEAAWDVITECLQMYGGYGYCEDYPLEKIARDAKVHSLWEGTTYIQARDLVKRKFTMADGRLLGRFREWTEGVVEQARAVPCLSVDAERLAEARAVLNGVIDAVLALPLERQLLVARRVLTATAQVYAAACLLDQALTVCRAQEEGTAHPGDAVFYEGKLMVMRYYLRNVLPQVNSLSMVVRQDDDTALSYNLDILEY